MKGDIAADISCPLCETTLHPRSSKDHRAGSTYQASPRVVERKAMHQHLRADHPGLGVRDRSLLCDQVADGKG